MGFAPPSHTGDLDELTVWFTPNGGPVFFIGFSGVPADEADGVEGVILLESVPDGDGHVRQLHHFGVRLRDGGSRASV